MPKLFALFLLGAGDVSTNHVRRSGYGLAETGYRKFYHKQVEPLLKAGVTRLWFHNPHGTRYIPGTETEMQLDQLAKAQQAGLKNMYAEFGEVLRLCQENFAETVCYYGYPFAHESHFGTINKIRSRKRREGLWDTYADLNIAPAVDAGCSIGLDSSYNIKSPEDGFYRLWRRLVAKGTRVYVETFPAKECLHLASSPYCVASEQQQRADSIPGWLEEWGIPMKDLTGECVVLQNSLAIDGANWSSPSAWPPAGSTWAEAHTPKGGWMTEYMLGQYEKGRSLTMAPHAIRALDAPVNEYFGRFGVTFA